jgi:hypothetical protein
VHFQVQFGIAKQTSLVIDQSAFARPERFWVDEYPYAISELRYAWRQPLVDQQGGIDGNGIVGLIREHDLVIGCLLREIRATRARLDRVLDFLCAQNSRQTTALLPDDIAALVTAMHDERDAQATRRAFEHAEAERVAGRE